VAAKTYQVSEVARISGVTVRALHHYDRIGLLSPQLRTAAGYRLYSAADMLVLQQILLHRELGLPLLEIKALLDDPHFDHRATLLEQRERLQARAHQTQTMLAAVDAALQTLKGQETMSAEKLFDGFDPARYEDEVRERWGDQDAYKESARRTKGYTEEDWSRIKAETHELMDRVAEQVARGANPTDEAAMDLAEEHRLQIDRFYYPCDRAMHAGLGQMYTADARFKANLDRHGDGVAEFLASAIAANAARGQ